MNTPQSIQLNVNGKDYQLTVQPHRTLLDVLRNDLDLKGTKPNCLEGECGACTVLLDGLPVNSCLYLAVRANGKIIRTIEGLAEADNLHPVQQAFIDQGGIQCGYCTPGFVMSTVALLEENGDPSIEDINEALSGNICRCTGYDKIRSAVQAAAHEKAAAKGAPE